LKILFFLQQKAREFIGEGVERVLKSDRGDQRYGGEQRDVTEIEERGINSYSHVSLVKTFIFSSSGTVILFLFEWQEVRYRKWKNEIVVSVVEMIKLCLREEECLQSRKAISVHS
jgi:hypothetical protein